MRTVPLWQTFPQVLLISVLIGFFGPLLHAQEIHIRVLNARNGNPITNECLSVSLGSWHGGDLVAPTNSD